MQTTHEAIWRNIPISETAGLLVYNPDCHIISANDHTCRVLGCSEDELVGKTITNYFTRFIAPEGILLGSEDLPVPRVLREKKPQQNRVLGLLGKGKRGIMWAVVSALPVFGENGEIDRVVVSFLEFENEHGKVCGREQNNTEKALKDLLEFNRQIIAGGAEGIVVYNKELKYVLWNPFMESMTGLPQDEVLGKYAFEIFPHLQEIGIDKLISRALEGETAISEDVRYYIPQTGKTGWMSGTYAPHKDAAGRVIGIIAMIRDITERKKAEEERMRSERQFRTLMDSSFDFVYVHDLHGNFLDANQACFIMTGYTKEEIPRLTLQSIVHPEDTAKAYQGIIDLVKTGFLDRLVEYRVRCKDGSWLDLETSAALLFREGKPYAVQGVARNITPHKRAKENLRRSEERFRTVFEQASFGMVMAGSDLRFTMVNTALCEMLGYTAEELEGKTFRDITHPAHLEADAENIARLVRGETKRYLTRTRYLRKNGTVVWGELSLTLVMGTEGHPLCGLAMIEDLSKRPRTRFPFFRI